MARYLAQGAEKRERSRGGRRKRRRMRLQSPIIQQPEEGSASGKCVFNKGDAFAEKERPPYGGRYALACVRG